MKTSIHWRHVRLYRFVPVLALVWLVEGCYTSVVRVETAPPGATIHYDYEPKGETPTEFEIDWYGTHRITLDHPTEGRRVETVELKAPAHLWFPFDFITAILPFQVTDRQTFTFDLTEKPIPERENSTNEPTEPKKK